MTAVYATKDEAPWNARPHPHRESEIRTGFEVDKDRIIHCETFRSLQRKTQVQAVARYARQNLAENDVVNPFRTRLNHVLEVAQISRGIAKALGADESLAEAIALAHDLGHPPFGHAGERALRRLLARAGHGEWNANVHSLAVVDFVEQSHIRHRGLNLTWATREGIARHSTPFDEPVGFGEFALTPNAGIECQIADLADITAYLSHDLDDALAGELIELDEVADLHESLAELVEASRATWETDGKELWPTEDEDDLIRKAIVSRLVGLVITATVDETARRLEALAPTDSSDVRNSTTRMVATPGPVGELIVRLLDFLTVRYYRSEDVQRLDNYAEELIYLLFDFLLAHSDYVPARFKTDDWALSVAHYLISLDDYSAERLARQLEEGSV